jgi:hypothetical protein
VREKAMLMVFQNGRKLPHKDNTHYEYGKHGNKSISVSSSYLANFRNFNITSAIEAIHNRTT